jgi:hypothetical protein
MISTVIALVVALGLLQGAPGGQGAAPGGQGVLASGMVTGQVQTREGAPAAAVRVAAVPAPPPQAAEGLNYYVPPPPTRVSQTDEQGRYRLANLPPGRYLIAAGLIGVGTYFPSEREALRATVVTVGADAPATADIRMVTPMGARVSGRVTPPPSAGSGEIAVLSGVTLAELAEVPVGADGLFTFGRVPAGRYLVSIFPTPPGFGSSTVDVREADVTNLDITRPPTHAVSGRIVVTNGPIPNALLALVADKSYVPIRIDADGTFTARAHSALHRFELSGVPVGYSLASTRLGSQDLSQGLRVGNADISGVTVTISAPRDLPRMRGTIAGLTKTATVEMRGPIIGTLSSPIAKDGSFEFAAVPPGLYYLRVPEAPELGTHQVVVGWQDTSAELKARSK